MDNKLNFSEHISNITRSATRQLNCLKRLGHFLDQNTRLLLYKSFVLSNFNYCPAVWHFCGALNALKLEKIQLRALRFVYDEYNMDYESLLQKANLPSLELSRIRHIAIEVFKAIYKLNPAYICNMFQLKSHSYSLRSVNTLFQSQKKSTKGGLHSFSYFGSRVWNSLPNELRTTSDLTSFKRQIKNWDGHKCRCNFCKFNL